MDVTVCCVCVLRKRRSNVCDREILKNVQKIDTKSLILNSNEKKTARCKIDLVLVSREQKTHFLYLTIGFFSIEFPLKMSFEGKAETA